MSVDPCDPESCDGDWHTCPDCDGGTIFVPDDSEDCPVTDFGEGEWRNCPTCRGDGGWDCPRLAKEAK